MEDKSSPGIYRVPSQTGTSTVKFSCYELEQSFKKQRSFKTWEGIFQEFITMKKKLHFPNCMLSLWV